MLHFHSEYGLSLTQNIIFSWDYLDKKQLKHYFTSFSPPFHFTLFGNTNRMSHSQQKILLHLFCWFIVPCFSDLLTECFWVIVYMVLLHQNGSNFSARISFIAFYICRILCFRLNTTVSLAEESFTEYSLNTTMISCMTESVKSVSQDHLMKTTAN